uniref:CD40 ligand n=1 Tax=Pogona vitticeps TaxID=103695 RepID=A0A6J0UZ81_9SAUR
MDSSGEPYSSSAPRTAGLTVTMKAFLSLITAFVITQLVGTFLFGLYLHMKLDKLGDEMNLGEDIVFLRKLQKCQKPQDGDGLTFLDCTKILRTFQDLRDLTTKVPQEGTMALQKGSKRPSATIHLAGQQSNSKVLQWKKATYASLDDTFSFQDGRIKVAKAGWYYVYSQVAFCPNPSPHTPFSVYLYLNLPFELDQLLLKGVGTHGGSVNLCDRQSIHLGRAVELQAGHELFVNVTDSSRVNFDHGSTFFGMFELP